MPTSPTGAACCAPSATSSDNRALCTRECRLVRVTGVLIFAHARACAAFVLPAAGPVSHLAGARLRTGGLPRARRRATATTNRPAVRPVTPGAMPGMTYRDEQNVRPTAQTTPCRIGAADVCADYTSDVMQIDRI